MTSLEQIRSFGDIAAEEDRLDPLWQEYFLESSSWKHLIAFEKCIFLGRKGTGKTALRYALSELAQDRESILVADLGFRDYPWSAHNEIFDPDVSRRYRFVETWRFLILLEVARLVVQHAQGRLQTRAITNLRNYLLDGWSTVEIDHKDIFREDQYQVLRHGNPVAIYAVGSVNWEFASRRRMGRSIRTLNAWLADTVIEALGDLGDHRPEGIFVVFDELDLDFDATNDEYLDSMIALTIAVTKTYSWAKEARLPIAPVLLIRDDIYEVLQFPDKNKASTSLVERIRWSTDPSDENSLQKIINFRIRAALGTDSSVTDVWNEIFQADRMHRNQTTYNYMIARTFHRPRDLISYCNLALDAAHRRLKRQPNSIGMILREDINAVRGDQSDYLKRELDDEIGGHENVGNAVAVIRRLGRTSFTLTEFLSEWGGDSGSVNDRVDALRKLYTFGVVGMGSRAKRKRDQFFFDSLIEFDPDSQFFRIHAGLKEAFQLVDARPK